MFSEYSNGFHTSKYNSVLLITATSHGWRNCDDEWEADADWEVSTRLTFFIKLGIQSVPRRGLYVWFLLISHLST